MRRSVSFREGRIRIVERKSQAAGRVVRIIHHGEGLYPASTHDHRRQERSAPHPPADVPARQRPLARLRLHRGAPTNPDWYHNLLAHPELTVEVGNETYDAIATPVTGEERDRIYARWAEMYPQYGEYQRNTTRKIPVIALQRRKG